MNFFTFLAELLKNPHFVGLLEFILNRFTPVRVDDRLVFGAEPDEVSVREHYAQACCDLDAEFATWAPGVMRGNWLSDLIAFVRDNQELVRLIIDLVRKLNS